MSSKQKPKQSDPIEERDVLKVLDCIDDDRVKNKIALFLGVNWKDSQGCLRTPAGAFVIPSNKNEEEKT